MGGMMPAVPILPTDIPGLDSVLGGGLSAGALVMLVGAPGAGKTVLASQLLFAAAEQGVASLILTVYSEGTTKLVEHLRPFAFFDERLLGAQVSVLSVHALLEQDPHLSAAAIGRAARERGARLVLVDGFQGLESSLADRASARTLLADLSTQIAYFGVTLLITMEGAVGDRDLARMLTTADVVLALEFTFEGWSERRRLGVIKQR